MKTLIKSAIAKATSQNALGDEMHKLAYEQNAVIDGVSTYATTQDLEVIAHDTQTMGYAIDEAIYNRTNAHIKIIIDDDFISQFVNHPSPQQQLSTVNAQIQLPNNISILPKQQAQGRTDVRAEIKESSWFKYAPPFPKEKTKIPQWFADLMVHGSANGVPTPDWFSISKQYPQGDMRRGCIAPDVAQNVQLASQLIANLFRKPDYFPAGMADFQKQSYRISWS